MSNGKGMGPMKGYNQAKYEANYDRIFRKDKNMKPIYDTIKTEPDLFENQPDWKNEWVGMPEFMQEKQREYAKIIVRFRNQDDLDDFAKLIGQKLNRNSQCTWHPELRADKSTVKKYISES